MKASNSKTGPQKPVDAVSLARKRLAAAELDLEEAKDRALQARKKRKEAKLLSRRAKKEAKAAKAALADARTALADAEKKAGSSAGRRAPARKPPAKPPTTPARKVAVRRKPRPNPVAAVASPDPDGSAMPAENPLPLATNFAIT